MTNRFGDRRLWLPEHQKPTDCEFELIDGGGYELCVEVFEGETITTEQLEADWIEFCNMIGHIRDSAN